MRTAGANVRFAGLKSRNRYAVRGEYVLRHPPAGNAERLPGNRNFEQQTVFRRSGGTIQRHLRLVQLCQSPGKLAEQIVTKSTSKCHGKPRLLTEQSRGQPCCS